MNSSLQKSKYKAGDVLITKNGKIFIIAEVYNADYTNFPKDLSTITKTMYKLKNHPDNEISADCIDNSHHISLASETEHLLYGPK